MKKKKKTKKKTKKRKRTIAHIGPHVVNIRSLPKKTDATKIILRHFLSPGDVIMLTAAVRDLHLSHPNKFKTDVRTSCQELWENNPYIVTLDDRDPSVEQIECEYPLIHQSNSIPYHFIHGFRLFLEDKLGIRIKPTVFKGDIYISDLERSWISQIEEMGIKDDFWIIVAGGKYDFTCVAAGTRVQTLNGYKKIEEITDEDSVLTEYGYKHCKGVIFKGKQLCLHIKSRLSEIFVTPRSSSIYVIVSFARDMDVVVS